MNTIVILMVGIWIGVAFGLIIAGLLLNKENEDE